MQPELRSTQMTEDLDRRVRNFLCISRHGSVSRAAEELNMSQPSLSRQLASLETYLGNPLFRRTGRGLVLTDAGNQLSAAAAPAFASIDLAVCRLREEYGVTSGRLRLATVHTLTYYFLGEVVARFVHQHEDVNVSFMARSSTDVVKLVESGHAQLGFVYDSEVASSELSSTFLFNEGMCFVAKAESELLAQRISLHSAPQKLVVFPPGYALRRMLDTSGLQYTVAAEVETVDAMLELVASGVGACILPALIPDRIFNQYGLAKTLNFSPSLARKVVAITRANAPVAPITEAMLAMASLTASAFAE